MVTSAGFAHVGLSVSDMDRSLLFWQDGLGLELLMRQEKAGGYLEAITGEQGAHTFQANLAFSGNVARLELLQYLAPKREGVYLMPAQVGGGHVAVYTDEIHVLVARLVGRGGVAVSAPISVDTGANKGTSAVYIRDPDGHILELIQPGPLTI